MISVNRPTQSFFKHRYRMDPHRLVPSPRPTVLIVDDHDDLRDAVTLLLETEGYAVADAANGAEALERLKTDPHVAGIILDLVMPIMDGWEFLAHWRGHPAWKNIPVLVLTGVAISKLRQSELAGTQVMMKPFTFDELIESIRAVMIRQVA
jgi:CheY-like chemotaxis protein